MQTNRVLALGFFDGVHLGHGALLRRTRQLADQLGCRAAALSFDVPPTQVITGTPVPLISSVEERELLLRGLYDMDDVLIRRFDQALMHLPWQDYVTKLLLEELHAVHVVCGADHRFGYRGEGTPERLQALCAKHGVGCDIIEKVELDGAPISSTRIRALLSSGDLDAAVRLLGHPQLCTGVVTHGAHRGSAIGFPTANLPFPAGALVPPFGVYCAKARLQDGQEFPAVVNIGVHPTAGSLAAPILEANLCGYHGGLYGQPLQVWLYHQLRPEQQFSSMEALRDMIQQNKQQTLAYFNEKP